MNLVTLNNLATGSSSTDSMIFPFLTLMLSSTTGQVSATDLETAGDSSSWYHHRAAQSKNISILVSLILEAIADTASGEAIRGQVLCEAPGQFLDGFFTIAFVVGYFGGDVRSCRSLVVVKFDLNEAVPRLERRDPFLDGNILVLTRLQGET